MHQRREKLELPVNLQFQYRHQIEILRAIGIQNLPFIPLTIVQIGIAVRFVSTSILRVMSFVYFHVVTPFINRVQTNGFFVATLKYLQIQILARYAKKRYVSRADGLPWPSSSLILFLLIVPSFSILRIQGRFSSSS
jgi:hypothetical protein